MLKIEHLRKTFNAGTVNEKKVFTNLNLTVEDGDFITIIGSNGAGKSTMLNAIAGSLIPDGGNITLNDKDITLLPEVQRAKYIGRVFQDPMMGTAPNMWISENLALAYRRGQSHTLRWGMPKGEEMELFKTQLARLELGLENRLETKVGLLSGGQRQAITLLMATIKKPELLLLDEHTAALDPKTAATVLDISDKIVRENNLTTLMVTHNMQNAIDFGNRLIMMHNGSVIY
ncbi:MAG: ATP-binding cassette domain-containing protein, partial [Firmicutes bacterium]|nr:ATP-binding cassette domain-containing protein [Bacillota bacterium]